MTTDVRARGTGATTRDAALPPLPDDFPKKYRELAYWCPICSRWIVAECPIHGRPRATVVGTPSADVASQRERLERQRAAQETLEGRVDDVFLRAGPAVFALWQAIRRELRLSAADMLDYMELAHAQREQHLDATRVDRVLSAIEPDPSLVAGVRPGLARQPERESKGAPGEEDPAAPLPAGSGAAGVGRRR